MGNKITTDNLLLFFILIIAAILRFWDFSGMPFMHDELSALLRAQTNSFSELIQKAKETDVHPVGVPIFVHYWSALAGKTEVAIKLPFILFSLLSVYYSYKIAEKWFNSTVALFTAAFLATLQFPVMYGQLERPYASGMLFSVLMVWYWTNFFFGEESKQNKNLFGFIITAALCTYNHYFSLVFAVIVGITGLLFLNKKNAVKYILAGVFIIVLFIPHIPIFLYHLSIGDATENSWLQKPDSGWLFMFICYLFHYSKIVYALVLILFISGRFYFNRTKDIVYKMRNMRTISIIWGILPFIIAYWYSVHKNPVLQFSTMTFSLPFLLMYIFSFYAALSNSIKTILVTVILLINTYTLFAVRKHDQVFYKQPYEEMAKMSIETTREKGEKNVTVAHTISEGFMNYYFEKYNCAFHFINIKEYDPKAFRKFISRQTTEFFVAGNLPLDYISIIKEKYPFTLKKDEGFTYSVYCFSKNKPEQQLNEKVVFTEKYNLKTSPYWIGKQLISKNLDDLESYILILDSTQEYSITYTAKLKDIINSRHNIINVCASINCEDTTANPVLVLNINNKEESLVWSGAEYFHFNNKPGGYNKIYLSQLLSGVDINKYPDAVIKIYVWNQSKKKIKIDTLNIEVIESNPFIYGLYEPIE